MGLTRSGWVKKKRGWVKGFGCKTTVDSQNYLCEEEPKAARASWAGGGEEAGKRQPWELGGRRGEALGFAWYFFLKGMLA